MRSKFKWIFTFLVALTMQFSFAQEKTVTGVVSDKLGPVAGANVVVKGTTKGTTTDFDGNYTIKAKQGDVLEFTYTGMKPQTIVVAASNKIDVVMVEDVVSVDEVVVVGYGTTTKEAYVGTAVKVNQESVEAKSVSNITQALKGEVAGVNVITTSGQPGSDATIRIRGFGSLNGNRSPLYVVDGVPYASDLTSINPADIESMTILKDATATAVYGSRGANGVVVITTKSGKANKSSVAVDFKTSFNMDLLPRYNVITSPEEYIELSWEAMYNRGAASGAVYPVAYANDNLFSGSGISPSYNMWNVSSVYELIDPTTGKVRDGVTRKYNPENWRDYAFQTSYRQEADVRFSGGNDKTKYFSSFGFLDDEGYIVNSNYRRYSTRLNLTHEVKKWLTAGANMAYTGSRYTQNGQSSDSGSIFWFTDNIPSIYPLFLRDSNGNKVNDPYFGGYVYDYGAGATQRGFGGLTNAIADAHYDLNRTYVHDLNGNFNFDFKLHKNLNFQVRYGGQYYSSDDYSRNNPYYGSSAEQFGSLYKTSTKTLNQNFLQLLTYKKTFGESHNFDAFVAHESTEWKRDIFYAGKEKAIMTNTLSLDQYINTVGQPSSYMDAYSLESYFGQVNYNYDGKYYFTGSIRRDGSSRFKNDKWGTFGSVGASWVLSKESFMENVDFVNFLKLKGSYGIIGDQGNELYYGYTFYTGGPLNDEYSINFTSNTAWDENITWEESNIWQVGLETTLFDRIDLSVDYYVKDTKNLFTQRAQSISTAIESVWVNDGQLRNKGLEFDVLAHIVKAKNQGDFKLDFGVNGEIIDNEMVKMPFDPATNAAMIIDNSSRSGYGLAKGHSIYDFYMREWAGVDPANGTALWNMYYDDINGDGIYNSNDDVLISSLTKYEAENPNANVQKTTTDKYSEATQKFVGKSAIPKIRGAFRVNTAYKNFDLSAQFTYSIGGYAYDSTYAGLMGNGQVGSNNWSTDIRNRWQQPGDITDVPRLSSSYDTNVNSTSTRFLTKSDYLGLNNVRLGYTLPSKFTDKLQLSKFNLFVSGDNLLFFSKRKGFNPSTAESGASSTYRYSPLSTISMGVKVEF